MVSPPPPPRFERAAEAATLDSGNDIFGIRLLTSVDDFDSHCFLDDDVPTNAGGGLTQFEPGNVEGEAQAGCGDAFASASSQFRDAPGTALSVWHLHAVARSQADGDARSQIDAIDTFEAEFVATPTATASPTPTPMAHLYVHPVIDGTIAGAPLAEYEAETNLYTVQNAELVPFVFSPTISHITDGHHHDEDPKLDFDLPPIPVGQKVVLDDQFLFALTASNGGSQSADVTGEFSICSHDPSIRVVTASGATGDCGNHGDLAIVAARPVQAVYGEPMIAGKDTVVAVDVVSTFGTSVEATLQLTIDTPFGSQTLTDRVTIPSGCIGPKRFFLPHPAENLSCAPSETTHGLLEEGLAPSIGSDFVVTAGIVPDLADSDPTDDVVGPHAFSVKTTGLNLGYLTIGCGHGRIDCTFGTVDPAEYATATAATSREALEMLPLSPDSFAPDDCIDSGMVCVAHGSVDGTSIGEEDDLDEAFATISTKRPQAERAIAFVSPSYFPLHGQPDNVGFTTDEYGGGVTSIVEADVVAGTSPAALHVQIPTAVHEILHQILSRDFFDGSAHVGVSSPIPQMSGYLVGCCSVPSTAHDLMEESYAAQLPNVWIDEATYEVAATSFKAADPAVLLLVARETSNGNVRIRMMSDLSSGTPTRVSSHDDNEVELLDENGKVLSSRGIGLEFDAILEARPGAGVHSTNIHLDEAPVDLVLEYPLATARVRFREGDRVLFDIDPVPETLRDAIRGLPDGAFSTMPSERRNALLNKVDAFEKQLAQHAFVGALQSLQHDIGARVDDWLVDFDPGDGGLHTSKADLLSLIERIDKRIEARAATK